MLSKVKYLLALIFLPLAAWGVHAGGWWAYTVPMAAFGVIPLAELFWHGSSHNMETEEETEALKNTWYDVMVYSVVPLHYGLVFFYLWRVTSGDMSWSHLIGATWSVGLACGAYGINVAHELGHRKKPHEQWMAQALLLTSMYMHFFIEHNRGHHTRVATKDDPASARYGEMLYFFWLRSIWQGFRSAWELENRRLEKRDIAWWSLQNQMLRFQLIQGIFVASIFFALGWKAMVAFLVVATIGILLLETVNYIEHYGLERRMQENGRYERPLPIHSWNSDHPLGRIILFELTRHSDHHAHASRHYQVLRHFDESPQLPTGYPGMMTLAFFPPLWFAVMHRHIEKHRNQLQGAVSPQAQTSQQTVAA
ncbi:MAG: alkane 1-monooxygenase [Myxococcales bacterium]|nr:alkane 1-monooxygenase [Myxococcales bacterium]